MIINHLDDDYLKEYELADIFGITVEFVRFRVNIIKNNNQGEEMVGKDKKGNYICLEITGDKTCNGLLWDLNSELDNTNNNNLDSNPEGYYIKCPKCGKKHQVNSLNVGDGNPSKLKFIECLED